MRLSELFGGDKDSLILYRFMYGPQMQRPCPPCTSILDGLNGAVPHILQRTNIAVVAKSPLPRILTFARERPLRTTPITPTITAKTSTYLRFSAVAGVATAGSSSKNACTSASFRVRGIGGRLARNSRP